MEHVQVVLLLLPAAADTSVTMSTSTPMAVKLVCNLVRNVLPCQNCKASCKEDRLTIASLAKG